VVLAKIDNATTKAVVDSFAAVLNREPAAMRKTLTYDLGPRDARPQNPYRAHWRPDPFRRPHSPWQRGENENTISLLRPYIPKVSALSIYSQYDLYAIALSLNTRPRARLSSDSPLVVYTRHIALLQPPTDTVNPRLLTLPGQHAPEAMVELIDRYRALGNRNAVRRAQERLRVEALQLGSIVQLERAWLCSWWRLVSSGCKLIQAAIEN
jgi:hypothetical protein